MSPTIQPGLDGVTIVSRFGHVKHNPGFRIVARSHAIRVALPEMGTERKYLNRTPSPLVFLILQTTMAFAIFPGIVVLQAGCDS